METLPSHSLEGETAETTMENAQTERQEIAYSFLRRTAGTLANYAPLMGSAKMTLDGARKKDSISGEPIGPYMSKCLMALAPLAVISYSLLGVSCAKTVTALLNQESMDTATLTKIGIGGATYITAQAISITHNFGKIKRMFSGVLSSIKDSVLKDYISTVLELMPRAEQELQETMNPDNARNITNDPDE